MQKMSRRRATFIAGMTIIAVLAAAVWAVANYAIQHRQERAWAGAQQQAGEVSELQCDRTGRTQSFHCEMQNPAAGPDRYAASDLKAQQDMAEWSLAMLFANIGAGLVALLGVLLVAATLRQQVIATRAATDQAEMMRRQLRAYIHIVAPKVEVLDDELWLWLTFENTGNTPAYSTRIRGMIRSQKYFDRPPQPDVSKNIVGLKVPVATGAKTTLGFGVPLQLVAVQERNAQKGEVSCLYGFIAYEDFMGETHQTFFNYVLHKPKPGEDSYQLEVAQAGNEAD
ncbi:hypothetical protein U91I_00965 [alpha proteobacterium U9-1i]|nr:hypothetical protein U91I_00965 [alpha proteobacterium U9-1i]